MNGSALTHFFPLPSLFYSKKLEPDTNSTIAEEDQGESATHEHEHTTNRFSVRAGTIDVFGSVLCSPVKIILFVFFPLFVLSLPAERFIFLGAGWHGTDFSSILVSGGGRSFVSEMYSVLAFASVVATHNLLLEFYLLVTSSESRANSSSWCFLLDICTKIQRLFLSLGSIITSSRSNNSKKKEDIPDS